MDGVKLLNGYNVFSALGDCNLTESKGPMVFETDCFPFKGFEFVRDLCFPVTLKEISLEICSVKQKDGRESFGFEVLRIFCLF